MDKQQIISFEYKGNTLYSTKDKQEKREKFWNDLIADFIKRCTDADLYFVAMDKVFRESGYLDGYTKVSQEELGKKLA